jgi:hypothetical protein
MPAHVFAVKQIVKRLCGARQKALACNGTIQENAMLVGKAVVKREKTLYFAPFFETCFNIWRRTKNPEPLNF